MGNPSKNKADADERLRALTAVNLRVKGHPYADIAVTLNYADESGARHAVSRLLARREAESIDELRQVHAARLEAVLSSFWPAATTGDTDAARIVLRTLDQLARLFGVDAPARVAVDPPISDVEYASQLAELVMTLRPETARELVTGRGALGRSPASPPSEPWSNIGENGYVRSVDGSAAYGPADGRNGGDSTQPPEMFTR